MKKILYAKAIAEALHEEMLRDNNVIYLGEDVSVYDAQSGGSLAQTFGLERVIDTPVCEMTFTNFAIGAALGGKRPVVDLMFADLITFAVDPIINVAAKTRVWSGGKNSIPAVFYAKQGTGSQIGAVHSQCIEAWFMNVPGLKIVVPSTAYDAKGLLKTAIRDNDPVIFLPSNSCFYTQQSEIPEEDFTVPFGQARVAREGHDVTIVAWQKGYVDAMAAADEIENEAGISVEIVDLRTLVPLDRKTILSSVMKTGRAIIAHEAPVRGGPGGEIAAFVADKGFKYLKAPVKRVGGFNVPIPAGRLEAQAVVTKDRIKQAIIEIMQPL